MTKPRTWTEYRIIRDTGDVEDAVYQDEAEAFKHSGEVVHVRVTEILPDEAERARKIVSDFDEDYASRTSVRFFQGEKHVEIDTDGEIQLTEGQLEAMLMLLRNG